MATSHQGSENAFAKVLESAESAKATIQAFKAMETFFGGSLLSKESFLVTKKLFELKAHKQVIEFASRAVYAYLTKNDDPTRLLCANVLCLMAGSSFNLNNYDESLLYLNRAKVKLNQLLDDTNASAVEILLDIQTNMTTVKGAIGNTDEAVVHALNILEIKGNTLEEGCVELGDANLTVSDAYLRASDHKSALLYCKKALEIYEKHLGKDSMEDNNASVVKTVLDIHRKMFTIQDAMGNSEEAVAHELIILEIKKKTLEEDCVELGNVNMSVTDAYLGASDHKSALPYCTKALEIYEKHVEKASEEDNNASAVETLLDIHRKMFTIQDAIGNREGAILHVLNILDIRKKMLKEDSVQLGYANMSVAETYLCAFDHESALPYYIKALEIYEKHLGKMNCLVGFTYSILGAAYSKSDQKEQSAESLANAKKILDVTLGPHHLSSLQTSHRLSLVYAALERYDEAIGIEEKVVEGLQGMASSEQLFLEEAVKHLSDMKKGRDTESPTNASPSQSIDDANLAAKISKVGISDE